MLSFGSNKRIIGVPWSSLESMDGLQDLIEASKVRPQLIFKHSTRCNISSMAESRLFDRDGDLSKKMDLHHLDLLSHRNISDAIAEQLSVAHQSPQAILIKDGECVLDQDHSDVNPDELLEQA